MTTDIVPSEQAEITVLELAGQAANHVAASHVFDEYRQRKAANTLKAQAGDLALFTDFLASVGVDSGALAADPAAWRGVTWGIVEAFKQALLKQGYAIGSLNRALSTIKRYAALAFKAGALDTTAHMLIKAVTGYSHKEAKKVDEKRATTRQATAKKSQHVSIPVYF